MKNFLILWSGNVVSTIGNSLSIFIIGIWLFEKTNNVTGFSLMFFFYFLPMIVCFPFAGYIVDKFSRKLIFYLCDILSSVFTVVLIYLYVTGRMIPLYVYIIMALKSVCTCFQSICLNTVSGLIVERRHYVRVSGMLHMAQNVSRIATPLLAGMLLNILKWHHILIIDFATFIISIITVTITDLSQAKVVAKKAISKKDEIFEGIQFIIKNKPILYLAFTFAIFQLVTGTINATYTPYILHFKDRDFLIMINLIAGITGLIGALLITLLPPPKKIFRWVLILLSAFSAIIIVCASILNIISIGVIVCLALFLFPIIGGLSGGIWTTLTPEAIRGKVFSARNFILYLSLPVAYFCFGPLVDVFNRSLNNANILADYGPDQVMNMSYAGVMLIIGFIMLISCYLYIRLGKIKNIEKAYAGSNQ